MRYCVAALLVACVAAIPKFGHHGHHGHLPHHRIPFQAAGGLQNSVLFNGINGGRRLTGSGGHVTKTLSHHGKSIHVNDGRHIATATAHHDGRVSANVVPNVFPGGVGHLGGVGPVGGLGLGPIGGAGHVGGHYSLHGHRRGVSSFCFVFWCFFVFVFVGVGGLGGVYYVAQEREKYFSNER